MSGSFELLRVFVKIFLLVDLSTFEWSSSVVVVGGLDVGVSVVRVPGLDVGGEGGGVGGSGGSCCSCGGTS